MYLILFLNEFYLVEVVQFVVHNVVVVRVLLFQLKLIHVEVAELNDHYHVHIYVKDRSIFVFQYLIPKKNIHLSLFSNK
jgi:hypothetical protein